MTYDQDPELIGDLFPESPDADPEHDGWLARGVGPRDCANREGIRPCPFASCPHHLLLDQIHTGANREPSLAINRARLPMFSPPGPPTRGRRREIASTVAIGSPADLMFQRLAVERLWELPETCAREVAGRGEHEIRQVSALLGVEDEDEQVGQEIDAILCALRGAVIVAGGDPSSPEAAEAMIDALRDW